MSFQQTVESRVKTAVGGEQLGTLRSIVKLRLNSQLCFSTGGRPVTTQRNTFLRAKSAAGLVLFLAVVNTRGSGSRVAIATAQVSVTSNSRIDNSKHTAPGAVQLR